VVIEHSLLQVNHPQRSRQEENTQEPGKGCGMWVESVMRRLKPHPDQGFGAYSSLFGEGSA
jgi:hypothetical protein